MIVVAGSATLKADKLQEAAEAARAMREASLAEAGCLGYRFAMAIDDPRVMTIFEEWADADALTAHFATPHLAAFGAALGEFVDCPTELRRFEVSSVGPLMG
jgi:quinol monooxygenase YgiN